MPPDDTDRLLVEVLRVPGVWHLLSLELRERIHQWSLQVRAERQKNDTAAGDGQGAGAAVVSDRVQPAEAVRAWEADEAEGRPVKHAQQCQWPACERYLTANQCNTSRQAFDKYLCPEHRAKLARIRAKQ